MALFKIFKGTDISKLTNPANEEYIPLKDGYCYFDTTTGLFFIDAEVVKEDGTTEIVRAPINANRAIYDTGGQQINTTYIKNLSISGKTITYTKGDGTTGTITTQDNNTTYSAGTGLSLSGTTFNHSNSVTAATAQGDANKTLTFGGTFTIPTITYDSQGHITGKGTTTMTMPANPNVDTKVTQTATTSNASYPLLLAPNGQTATKTTTSYFDSGVTLNPSTNTITANISGNAATATKLDTARTISLTGSITGSGTFDGSGNLSIATTTNHTHNYAGSSSAGGAANSVKSNLTIKLNSGSTEGTDLFTFNGSAEKTINIIPSLIGASDAVHVHNYAGSESVGGPANSVKESLSFAVGGVEKGSYNGSQGHRIEINAIDLNISSALKYIGRTNNEPTGTTITLVSGNQVNAESGNVVIWTQGNIEYLLDDDGTWIQLGKASSFALAPHIHGNISNQGYITDEEGNSLSNRILISDGTGYIEGGIEISNTLTQKFLNENGTWQLIPTATTSAKGIVKVGNNISISQGTISITKGNVESALGFTPLTNTTKYALSDTVGGAANSVKNNLTIKLNDGSTEDTNLFTFNGSTEKTINITPTAIGASPTGHTHDQYLPLTAGQDKKLTGPLGLTKDVMYGTTLPSINTFDGQLFFLEEEDKPSLPTGGTAGQVLVKNSSTDGDASWTDDIKAMRDGNGNIINSTYLPLTGGTMTGNITMSGSVLYPHSNSMTQTAPSSNTYYEPIQWFDKDNKRIGAIGTTSYANGDFATHIQVQREINGTKYYQQLYMIINADGTGFCRTTKMYGAVWNDYAEFRICNENFKPGQVVLENGDDTLSIVSQRLQRGCSIVSDTFGFAIGETDEAKCPIAVSGRVLAYGYESREEFKKHIGWPVCSGPNGTVSIMTEEEEEKYPSRIIGTISSVPDYETWGSGNVEVNDRIWIKVK